MKSLEKMVVSPEGTKIAFEGLGGYIHIASGKTKSWLMDLKMNCSVRSMAFLDETNMITSGLDADIYLWDIRNAARCVAR